MIIVAIDYLLHFELSALCDLVSAALLLKLGILNELSEKLNNEVNFGDAGCIELLNELTMSP